MSVASSPNNSPSQPIGKIRDLYIMPYSKKLIVLYEGWKDYASVGAHAQRLYTVCRQPAPGIPPGTLPAKTADLFEKNPIGWPFCSR